MYVMNSLFKYMAEIFASIGVGSGYYAHLLNHDLIYYLRVSLINAKLLTCCGLVMQYGFIGLGQHWLR